jgi:TonB-dependent SusC/RagA subfamily outer membrane receptor
MPILPTGVSSALKSLKPHEIESIEVLKDVSSTSVYGTRGAHGVILIRTKRD